LSGPGDYSQVANEIWEVKGGAVTKWQGDILSYKQHLKATHDALMNRKDLG
jgi:ATP-binding cassette subfamily F protein 2